MDLELEAIAVVGLVTLGAGLLLYLPVRWYARREARRRPHANSSTRITVAGLVVILIIILVLVAGLTLEHLAPDSWLGTLVSTKRGRLVWGWMVVCVFAPIALVLERMGMKFTRRHGDWDE